LVPSGEPEALNRRSTRIVQSVPLIVEGVDALGKSFRERTSTLIINCHGCKYLSKYFIPLDSWVTLTLPPPDPTQETRRIRARVTWVYRPRTVQELLQVGVELETPGNIWGIAFPPDDWFPFPDAPAPEIPAAALHTPAPKPQPAPAPLGFVDTVPPARRSEAVLPSAEEIEKTVLAVTARVVAEQTARLTREMSAQVQEAAKQAIDEAARSTGDQMIRRALGRIEEARRQQTAALQEECDASFRRGLDEARQQLVAGLEGTAAELREGLVRQVQTDLAGTLERIEQASREVDTTQRAALENLGTTRLRLARLREEMDEAEKSVSASVAERIRRLYETGQHMSSELLGSIEAAVAEGKEELTTSRTRLQDAVQSAQAALQARQHAIQETLEALTRRVREAQQAAEAAIDATRARADSMREEIEVVARSAHADLEAQVQQMQQAVRHLNAEAQGAYAAFSAQVATHSQEVQSKTRHDADAVLSAMQARQAELEQAQQRLEEGARSLVGQTEESLTAFRRNLDATSESVLAGHASRLADMEERFEKVRQEAAAAVEKARAGWREQMESDMAIAGSQWNSMLDEAVLVASERLQASLAAVERDTVERITGEARQQLAAETQKASQAADDLARERERAAEFVKQREQQLQASADQAVQESFERITEAAEHLRKDFESAAQERQTKWFQEIDDKGTDTIHSTFEAFYKASEWYQKKASVSMETLLNRLIGEATQRLHDQAGDLSRQFATELNHQSSSFTDHTRALIEEASQEMTERARQRLEELRAAGMEALENQIHQASAASLQQITEKQQKARGEFAQLADETFRDYGSRLGSVSSEWLTASVQALHARSQSTIEALTRTTEERVHEALSAVLNDFAETVRGRLLGISPQKQG